MMTRMKLLVGLAISVATASAYADPMVYTTNLFQQFGTLNLATGAYVPIGPGLSQAGTTLVPGSAGTLLTLSINGDLESIDTATGVDTVIGATGLGGNANELALLGGQVFATDLANNLYSVNTATGAATLIGATGIPAVPAYPFTTNPDGSLNLFDETFYGVGSKLYATFDAFQLGTDGYTVNATVSPNLWTIDPVTGAATLLAATDLQLLAGVEDGGSFYALGGHLSAAQPFPGFSTIEKLDLATGKTTFVADVDPAAGTIFGMSPVISQTPEPSSLVMLGTGLLAIGAKLRGLKRSIA